MTPSKKQRNTLKKTYLTPRKNNGEYIIVKCTNKKHKGLYQRHVEDDLTTMMCPICKRVGTFKKVLES